MGGRSLDNSAVMDKSVFGQLKTVSQYKSSHRDSGFIKMVQY